MKIKDVKDILSGKRQFIDVWHYFLGNYRYKLYYWRVNYQFANKNIRWIYRIKLHKLIRRHIFEQITYRIKWMDRDCYNNGSCKMCGCETTALQMSNKPCDKPCYPSMMNKKEWMIYSEGGFFKDKNGNWTPFLSKDKKPTLIV